MTCTLLRYNQHINRFPDVVFMQKITTPATHEELYPIREVSRLTGVNPVTLRAWERRYGFIQPTRTESGHRLYSLADIEAVRNIQTWIGRGVSVSKVGGLLARHAVPAPDIENKITENNPREIWQARLQEAIQRFDSVTLEILFGQLNALYTPLVVMHEFCLPLWRERLLRREQFGQTSEWLFWDTFLRARLWQRFSLGQWPVDTKRPALIVAALPNAAQELELLTCALMLLSPMWQIIPLAVNQPLDELPFICERQLPAAVVLFSDAPTDAELLRHLLRLSVGIGCPLALAGEASVFAAERLAGSVIACLGSDSQMMLTRLQQFLQGHLDT